jgi:hypothetical protein
MGGKIEGIRLANILFPVPGDPLIKRLWPPAATTAAIKFISSLKFISSKFVSRPSGSRCSKLSLDPVVNAVGLSPLVSQVNTSLSVVKPRH